MDSARRERAEPTDEPDAASKGRLLVACLCAEWCTACREYRAVFDQVAAEHSELRFLWVDIEDCAALMDQVEVENFPTILIGAGEELRFFGTIKPQRDVLLRVIAAHRERAAGTDAVASDVRRLLQRLQEFAG